MKTGEGKSPMQLPVELASSLGVQFLLTKVSDGMADPFLFGKNERDNEQALIALKKGTQLIKYSRKGKPKLRPFRISAAVFRRYLPPEKDYLSFSLLYNNSERSLDLMLASLPYKILCMSTELHFFSSRVWQPMDGCQWENPTPQGRSDEGYSTKTDATTVGLIIQQTV